MASAFARPLKSFRQVLPIIRWHHERQDGSGYPDHLTGRPDSPHWRVSCRRWISIDALTTDRPYRKALSSERAFAILRDEVRRGWWDGKLVDEFEKLLKESPEVVGHEQDGSYRVLGFPPWFCARTDTTASQSLAENLEKR